MNRRLSRYLVALLLLSQSKDASARQEKSTNLTPHEIVQDCLRQLWDRPIFWDQRAIASVDPSLCKAKPEEMEQALKAQHFVAFRLTNAVLLAQENSFDKNNGPFVYLWKTPTSQIRVRARATPGSRPPTEAELQDVADKILKFSHLAPLTCPFKPSEGQVGNLVFNISVEIHKMHIGSQQESVIALISDGEPDHETVFGAGRFVYGNLEDGHFRLLWETPLFEASMVQSGFVDLLRNGSLQITLTSNFGMGNHTAFYAFDLEGRELTRQPSTCEIFSDLTKQSVAACPITTETSVNIDGTAAGPKDLVTTDEAGKKVRYIFKGVRYELSSSAKSSKPPLIANATAFNSEGMNLMRTGNYEAAISKFEQAAQLNSFDPLFANNAGFAYYKLGQTEDSLYWFKRAIEIDSSRAIAYLNLGDAYAKVSRITEAREAYTKYLELAPDSKSAPDVKKKLAALRAAQ